jgi:4-amino-4-deoxy-L-arabinose transferase-like glycosyltransferase
LRVLTAVPWLLAAALAGTLLARAGAGSLYDGDEAVYGEYARDMRAGDPLTLRWSGQPVHQRPPGFVWALAISTAIGGESERPMRAPSALAAAAAVLAAAALARRVARSEAGADDAAGTAAALVFATLGLTWWFGLLVESDLFLGAVCALAVERFAAAVLPDVAPAVRRRRLLAFGALVGAACMVKQVVGLLPLAAPAAWLLGRDRVRLGWRAALGALGAGLAVWAPWHIYMTARWGGAFWSSYLGFNVIARSLRAVVRPTPVHYYWDVLGRYEGRLAAAALLAALAVVGGRALWRRSPGLLIVAAPPAAALLAFTLVRTRIDYYLLAMTPLLGAAVVFVAGARARATLAAGVLLAGLGLISHRGPRMANLDPSPALRTLAARARAEAAPGTRLIVLGAQPSGARYYTRLPTTRLIVGEAWRYRILIGIDIFAVPGALAAADDARAACASGLLDPPALLLAADGAPVEALRAAGCVGDEVARAGRLSLHRGAHRVSSGNEREPGPAAE